MARLLTNNSLMQTREGMDIRRYCEPAYVQSNLHSANTLGEFSSVRLTQNVCSITGFYMGFLS